MSEKDKNLIPETPEEVKAADTEKTAADVDAIMRKYDKESNVRIWEGKPKIFVGIVLAAGMIPLAIIGSVIIGVIMIVFCNRKSSQKPFIAVISCDNGETEKKVAGYLKENADKVSVKSKSAQKGSIELTYEVTLKNNDTDFITKLSEMDGVGSAVLVSYNGDYMG